MSVKGSATTSLPAVALIDAAGDLKRATEPFRERYGDWPDTLAREGQLTRIFGGQLDRASVSVEGIALEIEAVRDTHGGRHALITLPGDAHGVEGAEDPNSLLSMRLDESPALVWLKDLEGRYLHANHRFTELLGTTEERLLGHTDDELPAHDVVDGPRVQQGMAPDREPLQLEYTIGAFEGRPAFAVLRFAVRDHTGEPIAVCGVAAPVAEVQLARTECSRLMQIERWSRLDSGEIKRELLDAWGMVHESAPVDPFSLEDEPDGPAAVSDRQLELVITARDEAIAERDVALSELSEARREIDELGDASAMAADEYLARAEAAEGRLASIEADLADERQHAAASTERIQAELDEERERSAAEIEQLRTELDGERRRSADAAGELADSRHANDDVQRLGAELAQERQRAASIEGELSRLRESATETEDELSRLRDAGVRAEQLQQELNDARQAAAGETEISELRHAAARVEQLQAELHRLRESAASNEAERRRESDRSAADIERLQAEIEQERQRSVQIERLEAQLEQEQELTVRTEDEHRRAAAQVERLKAELDEERKRSAHAEQLEAELESASRNTAETAAELADQRHQASDAKADLAHARQELERMRTDAQTTAAALSTERSAVAALRQELSTSQEALATTQQRAAGEPGSPPRSARRWTPAAQRAIVASIAAASDWRTGLKDAIKVLGSVGGWTAVTAWCPGERDTIRCAAMWTESDSFKSFETQTWQRSEPAGRGELGAAMSAGRSTGLTEARFRDDRHLRLAAAEGMRSALLVPVRDGARTIALLEFLSQEPEAPDAEVAVSLEAVGLQLGHFAHLLRLGTKPHWSLGRI